MGTLVDEQDLEVSEPGDQLTEVARSQVAVLVVLGPHVAEQLSPADGGPEVGPLCGGERDQPFGNTWGESHGVIMIHPAPSPRRVVSPVLPRTSCLLPGDNAERRFGTRRCQP